MALSSRYRFWITEGTIGTVEVFPKIETLEYSWDKAESLRNLKKGLGSDITLQKADFQTILTLEQAATCTKIDFAIDVYCGGAWVRDFDGIVILRKCKYDLHQCEVTLGIEPNGIIECLEFEKKVNILDGTTKQRVKSIDGTIETFVTNNAVFSAIEYPYDIANENGITTPSNWGILINEYTNIVGDWGSTITTAEIQTTYIRQKLPISATPLGAGWVTEGAFWVRPMLSYYNPSKSFNEWINGGDSFKSVYTPYGISERSEGSIIHFIPEYTSGVLLSDVMEKILNGYSCTYTVVSDFFDINGDNTHPTNTAYSAAFLYYRKLVIWKTADIKRPESSQQSTIMELSLSELMSELKILFNVSASIYTVLGVNYFRIEHESFWGSVVGLDATTYDATDMNTYSYDADKLPRSEKFLFAAFTDGVGGTFDGSPILYPASCSDVKTTNEYRAELTLTNFTGIYKNDRFADNGICIGATYLSGTRLVLLGDATPNDCMGFKKLLENCLYFGRPFNTGTVNGVNTTFIVAPTKTETVELLKVPHCTINNFLTENLVTTLIGNGEIKSAKYDAQNCKLSLTLSQF